SPRRFVAYAGPARCPASGHRRTFSVVPPYHRLEIRRRTCRQSGSRRPPQRPKTHFDSTPRRFRAGGKVLPRSPPPYISRTAPPFRRAPALGLPAPIGQPRPRNQMLRKAERQPGALVPFQPSPCDIAAAREEFDQVRKVELNTQIAGLARNLLSHLRCPASVSRGLTGVMPHAASNAKSVMIQLPASTAGAIRQNAHETSLAFLNDGRKEIV